MQDTTGSSSRATGCRSASRSTARRCRCSARPAGSRLRSRRSGATPPGSAGPEPSCRPRSRSACARRLAKDHLHPGLPLGRGGGGLLREGLQRHALAALPLLPRPAADHARGVGAVRRGERALRRHDPRALRARLARVGARLPPHARAGDAASARAAALDRLLPAHPVPVVRGVPAAPGARAAPARRPRRRLRQLPGRRLRAPLPLVVPAHARHRLRARLARARRAARRDRRRSDRHRRRRLPRGRSPSPRPSGSSPISRSSTRAVGSSSASSGSTTRRGSRRSSTRSSASSSRIPTARGRRR